MSDLLDKHSESYDPDTFTGMVDDQRKREKENTLDAILPAKPLPNPFTGEVLDADDLDALKSALAEIESFLSDERKKHRRVYDARDRIQARVVELDPIGLPRISRQTDRQRRVERCPRCSKVLIDSGLEPEADSQATAAVDSSRLPPAKGAAEQPSSPEQSELLPRGPRTPEQEAALGVDIFGEPTDFGQRPPLPGEAAASVTHEESAPEAPPGRTEESSPSDAEADPDGGETSAPLDPIVVQAGEVKITRGSAAGKTVAEAVADEPERCLRYLELGKDERLLAAFQTYILAVRPELMEGE